MLLPLAAVSSCIYDGAKGTKALYGREKGIMSELAIAVIVFCVRLRQRVARSFSSSYAA
jgi:hypothetical protein